MTILSTRGARIAAACAILAALALPAAAQPKEAQNPVVKARMDLMGTIRMNTGVLGDMASGKAAFDAAKAGTAKAALTEAAAAIPAAFEPQETDPASEALPAIWQDWDDFAADAKALETAAGALDTSSVETIKAGMGGVGGACRDCHGEYRAD
ncbi:c-type cytochrome [Frigidibacter sp. MR17.24]|uniref:c-type cytochrome n=1 Tax=Frigidibacter sp. MR17.24 TaxID=3127345 RepID=UPI003012F602